MEGIEYPETRTDDVVETIHGVEVRDPYRWLENKDDPEVKDWIERQMAFSKKVFESFGNQEPIKKRLRELSFFDAMSSQPVIIRKTKDGLRFFYLFRYKDDPQMRLCYQDGVDGTRIDLFNPNIIDSEGLTQVDCFFPSPTGELVVLGYSKGGSEKSSLRILNVESKVEIPNEIPDHFQPSVAWISDSEGFYYVVNGYKTQVNDIFAGSIFYHCLDSDVDDVRVLSAEGRPLEMVHIVGCFGEGRLVAIRRRAISSDLIVLSTDKNNTSKFTISVLIEESPKISAQIRNNVLYVLSQKGNSNGEVVVFNLNEVEMQENYSGRVILCNRSATIEEIAVLDNYLLFTEFHDVKSKLFRMDLNTRDIQVLSTEVEVAGISALSTHESVNILSFSVNAFEFPIEKHIYHPKLGFSKLFTPKLDIIPSKFTVRQEWFTSGDGTNIPMYIMHKEDLDITQKHPVLISCYGGYGMSLYPTYSPLQIVWCEIDCIFVVANLRGGGEFGKEWHFQGIKKNKQNVIDDLISASSWFIENGFAFRDKVSIRGSSNGGLVVLSAMTQKPQLFSSIFAGSPLADMVRFVLNPLSKFWIPEYGDPRESEDFEWLYAYSPYHHISSESEYPSVLFYIAQNDARVLHMHALKSLAKLQSVPSNISKSSSILWLRKDAGHKGGMAMDGWVDLWFLELMFHIGVLNLKVTEEYET